MILSLIAVATIHFHIGTIECWSYPQVFGLCSDGQGYALTYSDENDNLKSIELQ